MVCGWELCRRVGMSARRYEGDEGRERAEEDSGRWE